jgi:hypothetical protein
MNQIRFVGLSASVLHLSRRCRKASREIKNLEKTDAEFARKQMQNLEETVAEFGENRCRNCSVAAVIVISTAL